MRGDAEAALSAAAAQNRRSTKENAHFIVHNFAPGPGPRGTRGRKEL